MTIIKDIHCLANKLKQEYLFVNFIRDSVIIQLYRDIQELQWDITREAYILQMQNDFRREYILGVPVPAPSPSARLEQLAGLQFVRSADTQANSPLAFHFWPLYEAFLDRFRTSTSVQCVLLRDAESFAASNSERLFELCRIMFTTLFATCLEEEDERLLLILLSRLIEQKHSEGGNICRLLKKGPVARLLRAYLDHLPAGKVFLTAVCHEPLLHLLTQREWFYDVDSQKMMTRFSESHLNSRFGQAGSQDFQVKVDQYRQQVIVSELVQLANRFVDSLNNNLLNFPPSLLWLIGKIMQVHSDESKTSKNELRSLMVELLFESFICHAVSEPESYGIISNMALSYICRHNLTQIGQILRVSAEFSLDQLRSMPNMSRCLDLYCAFEPTRVSQLLDRLIEHAAAMVSLSPTEPTLSSVQFQPSAAAAASAGRTTCLVTCSGLQTLVSALRDCATRISDEEQRNLIHDLVQGLPDHVPGAAPPHAPIIHNSASTLAAPSTPPIISFSPSLGRRKKPPMPASPDAADSSIANNTNSGGISPAQLEPVLVLQLRSPGDCPGLMLESKVLEKAQKKSRVSIHTPDNRIVDDGVHAATTVVTDTIEKKTRFSLSRDQESVTTASDCLEMVSEAAVSEIASTHSGAASDEDDDESRNEDCVDDVGQDEADNDDDDEALSDMMSANVSGRGTPSIMSGGRDSPVPELPHGLSSKDGRHDVTEKFLKFDIPPRGQHGNNQEKDDMRSTLSDSWSTDVLASESGAAGEIDIQERLADITEEMVRDQIMSLKVAAAAAADQFETASEDKWSVDVLASDFDDMEDKRSERMDDFDPEDPDQEDLDIQEVLEAEARSNLARCTLEREREREEKSCATLVKAHSTEEILVDVEVDALADPVTVTLENTAHDVYLKQGARPKQPAFVSSLVDSSALQPLARPQSAGSEKKADKRDSANIFKNFRDRLNRSSSRKSATLHHHLIPTSPNTRTENSTTQPPPSTISVTSLLDVTAEADISCNLATPLVPAMIEATIQETDQALHSNLFVSQSSSTEPLAIQPQAGLANSQQQQLTQLHLDADDILAKYRNKKPSSPATATTLNPVTETTNTHLRIASEELLQPPFYDANNPETCPAWKDAKNRLRTVLCRAELYDLPLHSSLPSTGIASSDVVSVDGETLLVKLLRLQLAQALNLDRSADITTLYEAIRVVSLFDSRSCVRLLHSMERDYRLRSPYIAYLVRTQHALNALKERCARQLARIRRERHVSNCQLLQLCVRQFFGFEERAVRQFQVEFKKPSSSSHHEGGASEDASDVKTARVEDFLKHLNRRLVEHLLFRCAAQEHVKEAHAYLERMLFATIYEDVLYINDVEADVERDKLLHKRIGQLRDIITPGHRSVGIPIRLHYLCPFVAVQNELVLINVVRTAADKLMCINRAIDVLCRLVNMALERPVGADDILPVLTYCLIQANPEFLLSNLQYVETFGKFEGLAQYNWMQFSMAVSHVKNMLSADL